MFGIARFVARARPARSKAMKKLTKSSTNFPGGATVLLALVVSLVIAAPTAAQSTPQASPAQATAAPERPAFQSEPQLHTKGI
jgi:hypothetical protein